MIKNIIFDIGNVILEGKPKNALKYVDLGEKDKRIIEDIVFDSPKWVYLDLGLINLNEYFNIIKDNLPCNLEKIASYVLLNPFRYRKINEQILDLIKNLSHSYKIYILSDNNVDIYEYLKNSVLNEYIAGWCVSCMHKELKINKKLYKIMFSEFKLNPQECYFIDDKAENIKIGQEFGMNGFMLDWVNNDFDKLIEDMEKNSIDFSRK